MGRKGRRSCDAWAEIFNRKGWLRACCSARRSAHWLLSRSHSAFIPPLLPEDACHVYYCTMNCRTFSNPLKKHHASVSKSLHRAWLIQSQEMNVLSPFFKVKKKKNPSTGGEWRQSTTASLFQWWVSEKSPRCGTKLHAPNLHQTCLHALQKKITHVESVTRHFHCNANWGTLGFGCTFRSSAKHITCQVCCNDN